MSRALQSALVVLVLSTCALCNCPDPEDRRTVIINVQDETVQQALTSSVNVASFTVKDAGEEYISLLWTPASLKDHAITSQVCTYMLVFNYLGVASTGGPQPVSAAMSLSLVQPPSAPAARSMSTVQYTNNTMATHHGLPPSTAVQVTLHVCLLVNASTMVCVRAADLTATTDAASGNASRLSASTTLRTAILSQDFTKKTSGTSALSSDPTLLEDSPQKFTTDASASVSLPPGIGGVAIVAATVVILTLISIAGVTYLVYRRCRMRWDPLPSHFWTIELQNEYDSVSFTGISTSETSGNMGGRGVFVANGGSSSGLACTDDHRRRLLDSHDNPYKLLTA